MWLAAGGIGWNFFGARREPFWVEAQEVSFGALGTGRPTRHGLFVGRCVVPPLPGGDGETIPVASDSARRGRRALPMGVASW